MPEMINNILDFLFLIYHAGALVSLCRSDAIELILSLSLFPTKFSVKDKVANWIRLFSGFDIVEVAAIEKILKQKQRFVMELISAR